MRPARVQLVMVGVLTQVVVVGLVDLLQRFYWRSEVDFGLEKLFRRNLVRRLELHLLRGIQLLPVHHHAVVLHVLSLVHVLQVLVVLAIAHWVAVLVELLFLLVEVRYVSVIALFIIVV